MRRREVLRSTRARVLLGALALLAGTLVVTVVADRSLLLSRLAERIDADLAQEVGEFERLAVGTDPETGQLFGDDLAAIFDTFFARNVPGPDEVFLGIVDGRPYLRSADAVFPVEDIDDVVAAWAAASTPAYGAVDTPAGRLRTLVVPVAATDGSIAGTFVVGRFPAGERAEVDDAIGTTALVSGAAFLLASLVAWSIAGRVLEPLRDLAATARSVGADDLGERIEVDGSGELADLSRSFNEMLDRIEGAITAQRAFLDDAGHELRTPITVIRGHLELTDPTEPIGESTHALVLDELDRMGRIVEDLLVMAKAEQPDFIVVGPVDVGDLAAEVVAKARPLAARDWHLRAEQAVVSLDRERIVQAWMNLVRNAVQHTVEGDRIEVAAAITTDGALELVVVDTGEGVAPGDADRIFERFGRGASVRRTRSDGAGLGLAIAAAIAEGHGGTLSHRHTPGGGATFQLVLPITDDHPEDPWPAS